MLRVANLTIENFSQQNIYGKGRNLDSLSELTMHITILNRLMPLKRAVSQFSGPFREFIPWICSESWVGVAWLFLLCQPVWKAGWLLPSVTWKTLENLPTLVGGRSHLEGSNALQDLLEIEIGFRFYFRAHALLLHKLDLVGEPWKIMVGFSFSTCLILILL